MIRWEKFVPMSFDFPWRHSLLHERRGKPCEWRPYYEPSVPYVRSTILWRQKESVAYVCLLHRHLTYQT